MTTPYLNSNSNPNKMDKSNDFQFTLGSKEFYFQWISWIFQRFPVTLKCTVFFLFEIDKKSRDRFSQPLIPILLSFRWSVFANVHLTSVALRSFHQLTLFSYIQISSPPRCSFNDDTRTCANFDAKRKSDNASSLDAVARGQTHYLLQRLRSWLRRDKLDL